jgi:hypothetical protein
MYIIACILSDFKSFKKIYQINTGWNLEPRDIFLIFWSLLIGLHLKRNLTLNDDMFSNKNRKKEIKN